jgi:hypothetical protein
MKEKKIIEKLPTEEVHEKIKEFYLKIKKVNDLVENCFQGKTKEDYQAFQKEWRSLCNEVSAYFQVFDFADTCWPHKKSILYEKECDFDISISDLIDGDVIYVGSRKKIKSIVLSYHVENNQDDITSNNQFPYWGMYLAFSLNYGSKNNDFSFAPYKTKIGCNLILPKINEKEMLIIGKKNSLKFFKEEDFKAFLQDIKNAGLFVVEGELIFIPNFVFIS